MARKSSALASLDIVSEGMAQQDGLAERLARARSARDRKDVPVAVDTPVTANAAALRDHNAWRRGKALLQVALPDEAHLELSILAKRRRMTLSQLVKEALNQWLDSHGHALRVSE